jgi:molybdenum cofactor cytidylyltransferase
MLVDQPTVAVDTIRAILGARGRRPLVVASAGGHVAPPVLIEPEAFDEVMALRGDIGLREVILTRAELVDVVEVPAHASDVDTVADLDELEARLGP